MALNVLIDADENGLKIEIIKYRGIIESLLYVIASRHDIMFSLYMCARFQTSLMEYYF